MFRRNAMEQLLAWKSSRARKPLILRGARQTGKTTLVQMLAKEFDQAVILNMELSADRRNWQGDPSPEELLRNIELSKGIKIVPGKTLLFLDEIQNEQKAIQSLRYLYEHKPDLHVIGTGSFMEFALREKGFSFPVGRATFLYLAPMNFPEFLDAMGRQELRQELGALSWNSRPSEALHALATDLFSEYVAVGGMPEVVRRYVEEGSHLPLIPIKEGLLNSFEEDVPKYCRPSSVRHVQLIIREAPLFAGQRIQYTNFARSGYPSREMKRAFEILEQAMILQRVPGAHQTSPPLQPNHKMAPKLIYLDTGLVVHRLSVDPRSLKEGGLNDLFRGTLAEQIVGQELTAQNPLRRDPPFFWQRQKAGSAAEVDYCFTSGGKIIPVEVKSGKSGRLRSLIQFMEEAPHSCAVRFCSGPLQCDEPATPKGKKFRLLSLPFYLASELRRILEGIV